MYRSVLLKVDQLLKTRHKWNVCIVYCIPSMMVENNRFPLVPLSMAKPS